MNANELHIQPTVSIGFGGVGGMAIDVSCAATESLLEGRVSGSECWMRSLVVDFVGGKEGPPSEAIDRYGYALQRAGRSPETFTMDVKPLLDLARSQDEEFDGLWQYCRRDLLARSRSSQAGQKPAISRAAFIYYLDKFETVVEGMLRSLAWNGEILHALRRRGLAVDRMTKSLRVALVGGAEGGTFHGCAMPAAIVVQSIASRFGITVDVELWVAYRYRTTNSTESRLRSALGEQFSRDIEIAQTPGRHFALKTLSGFVHEADGELFSRCIPFEGHGRLDGRCGALCLAMGEALAFRTVHPSAALIEANHAGNFLSRDRN